MKSELHSIVSLARDALKVEDTILQVAMGAKPALYGANPGGLLKIRNERYYQFVIARHLIGAQDRRVAVEVDQHDLVLFDASSRAYGIAIEMKRWMSYGGDSEIKGIKRDISEKLCRSKANSGLMMIFSANEPGQTQENIAYLSKELCVEDASAWHVASFPTIDDASKAVEFWVAGLEVATESTSR